MWGQGGHHVPSINIPALPSSLNAGDHEMRNYNDNANTHPPAGPNTAREITPYLGLQARLSQIWINRWTILFALVLARVLLAVRSLDDNLGSARREALSACTGVESMGSAMASMPHYMSQGVNELAAQGVEKAVNGLMSMLTLSVTAIEELVVFVVNLLTSTYVCLITLAVSGSLHVALEMVKDVSDFLNKTIGDIGNDIHKGIKGFQDDLNKFTSVLNSVPKFLGSSSTTIPTLNIDGSLSKLDHLQIPSKFNDELTKINSSIPNFAEVQNFTNGVLRMPFKEVKKLMNETMVAFKFDRSVFPVPRKEQINFCSDNNGINHFFDKLTKLANRARRTFIGLLVAMAILACIPMAYREIWRWRTMNKRAQLVRRAAYDPVDVMHIASRPTTSTVGIKVASPFRSTKQQILVRWFVAYITSTPALFLLSLGFAGLFACLCHYILLRTVEKETPALAHQVGQFAGKVVKVLNNASEQWAIGTNRAIASTNNDINREVLGWVNTTTGAVNNTLNAFVGHMSDALNTTFGGTVLYDPIKEVLNCLIGLKIAGVQKGLDWVSDHAHVDFPQLANDTFSLGAVTSIAADSKEAGDSFLADPSSKATDKITNAVAEVTAKIAQGIRTEAIISSFLLLLWVIILLIGLSRVLFLSCCARQRTRGEGGVDDGHHQSPAVVISPTNGGNTNTHRTRHSSFFFPRAFRNGPNSAESTEGKNDLEFSGPSCPESHNNTRIRANFGGRVNEKVGYAGMRNPVGVALPYDSNSLASGSSGGSGLGHGHDNVTLQPPAYVRESSYGGIVDDKGISGGNGDSSTVGPGGII